MFNLFSVYLEEYIGPHGAAHIILGHSLVHISSVRMVDDLSGGGVLLGVGDVVVHHDDDVVIRDAVGVDNLVSVTHVSLVTVVEPAIAASYKKDPKVSILR